jgi:hypothetical protein
MANEALAWCAPRLLLDARRPSARPRRAAALTSRPAGFSALAAISSPTVTRLAQDRPFADDLGIAPDVGRRGRGCWRFRRGRPGRRPARLRCGLLDRLEHRHHVGRAAVSRSGLARCGGRCAGGRRDRNPSRCTWSAMRSQAAVVEHQAADQRLLGLDRMRR